MRVDVASVFFYKCTQGHSPFNSREMLTNSAESSSTDKLVGPAPARPQDVHLQRALLRAYLISLSLSLITCIVMFMIAFMLVLMLILRHMS